MPMMLQFDGPVSDHDFHEAVAEASGIVWYGRNLNALDELLTQLVDPPITIEWKRVSAARESMGQRFDQILEVLRYAQQELGPAQFSLNLQ